MKKARGHWAPVCIVLAGAALVTLGSVASFGKATEDLVVLRPSPGRQGQGASLPRGEVLLFQFLQHLADASGKKVCYGGAETPGTKIELPRAINRLDASAAEEILDGAGYELSNANYKGDDVHWVQRSISTQRKKGRIIRKGTKPDREEAPAFKGTADPRGRRADPRGKGALDLYAQEVGSGTRYMVVFQTDSREEADEAVSLLKAHQQSKTGGTQGR